MLFDKKDAVILTSATLAVKGSFAYSQGRLGLQDATTLNVGSPFDYQRAALIYLPTDVPEPTQPGYPAIVEHALAAAAEAANGRMLALFTSHNHLRAASRQLKALLEPRIAVLAQGLDGSADRLLAALRSDHHTLLLGAASFWEGVDVVGEALSVLAVTRLPFSVPNDPIFAARAEQFDDPFNSYAVPQASLRLQQAFGRLVRSQTDRGVLVVLDRRLTSKVYGKALLESLPEGTFMRGPIAGLSDAIVGWLSGSIGGPID
jgi:DNA polymerase-3 subunit epsilon/ATP-dependent DNA helicase DinG